MKIVSIEPTPSPNSMKINLSESLPKGKKYAFTKEEMDQAPEHLRKLLAIEGVKSVFHAADFIALDRMPKYNWQQILAEAREALGEHTSPEGQKKGGNDNADSAAAKETYGEVKVLVQHFRGIPIQVRVSNEQEELRAALPERFNQAIMKATENHPYLIKERRLEELGVRYGELQDILDEVVQELDASYDDERLSALVQQAVSGTPEDFSGERNVRPRKRLSPEEIARQLDDPDWKKRYAALEQIDPSPETLPLLVKALQDENTSIRRLATVYLGDIKKPEVLPYLFQALRDENASVRRTAGDTLSDLGDPAAIGPMCEALKDKNKLVRWRAARFLYEVGDESAVSALRAAQNDPEFEVRMQVNMALERIEGGHAAEGSVWQQMTRRNKE